MVSAGGAHTAVAASWWLSGSAADEAGLLGRLVSEVAEGEVGVVLRTGGGPETSSGPTELLEGARVAALEHADRRAGRLVQFPGQDEIQRRLPAEDVVRLSCVDAVEALAGVEIGPRSVVDLTDFVRPVWREGRCVVLVQPSAQGLSPFEVRDQIACCADH